MTVIVPARNEVELLPTTLPTLLALLAQDYPGVWWVVLVDDRSNDGTAAIARGSATGRLTPGRPPRPRWLGRRGLLYGGVTVDSAVRFGDLLEPMEVSTIERQTSRSSAGRSTTAPWS